MSVAASLAALQQTVKRPTQRPAFIARSELAASARNAITVLQRADTQLGKLMRPLLLLSPEVDRLTLTPDAEKELQNAAVELIIRIAPVFLLRSTQSVLEWLLVGLSLATHGSDEEYDQLIISALPFCEQQSFVRLVKRMAPLRPKWEFLWPVVKQSKPPALSFMVKNFPQHLFSLVMDSAIHSASLQLHVSPLSSFLANTLTRRVLLQSEAPILTLTCVNALRNIASKKFLKKSKSVPNLIAALLTVVAVAMSAYLVDHSLLQAASHACACVLLNCKVPELRHSAASCLVLTSSTLPAFVPSKVARVLLRHSVLQPQLKLLDPSDASSLFGALILASIGDKPKTIRWNMLRESLALSSLLTDDTVRKCLVDILDKMSPELEHEGVVRHRAVEGLAALIAPLARGRFAESVDLALREHFNRREKSEREDRYAIVDEAFAKGLLGTQFASVRTSEDLASLSLSAALDHPEPSVRRSALQQFAENKDFESQAEAKATEAILAKLTAMIRLEEDLEIVNGACDCILKVSHPQDIRPILSLLVTRYVDEHEQMKNMKTKEIKKKKTKVMKRKKETFLRAMFSRVITFCRVLVTENCDTVHALLSGVVIAGFLPKDLAKDDEAKVLEILSEYWKKINLDQPTLESSEVDVEHHVTSALHGMLLLDDMVLTNFCDALKAWDGRWVLKATHLWLQRLRKDTQSATSHEKLRSILFVLSNLSELEVHFLHPVALTLTEHGKLFCELPSSFEAKLNFIGDVWSIVARDGSDRACKTFLHTIVSEFNLATCIEVLRDMCMSDARQETKAVSLKWYINLCVFHPNEEVRKESMIVLMRILYGNDTHMQKTALEVCGSSVSEEGMNKRELRTELWTFLTMVSKLHGDYNWKPRGGELERGISSEIQRRVIAPIKTPSPLLFSKKGKAKTTINFYSLMLNATQGKDNPLVLNAYLRALQGYRIRTEAQCSSTISLLVSNVSRFLPLTDEQNVVLENVARLTQTLSQAPTELLSESSTLTKLASVTLSVLKKVSSKAISSDDFCEKLLTTLLGLSTLLVNVLKESEAKRELRLPLLAYLFSFSTFSSRLGISVCTGIDILCKGSVSVEELVEILRAGYVILSPSPKRRKVSSKNLLPEFSEVARGACRGVLEALLRWSSRNEVDSFPCLSGPLDEFKSSLFNLLMSSTALKDDGHSSLDDLEYESLLLLQVQTFLYTIRPSRPNRTIDITQIANTARYSRGEDEDTPVTSAVRQGAVQLLEVLAPIYGPEMQNALTPVIESLVKSGDAFQTLLYLEAFLPALIKSGFDFETICSWVIEAGYSNGLLCDSSKGATVLSSCCKLMCDSVKAVMVSITALEKCLKHIEDDLVARECANLLLNVELKAINDIEALNVLPSRVRCRAAFIVLQSPVFISKLFSRADKMDTEEEMVFSTLFLSLLVCDDAEGRRDSVAALAAILPLPVFKKIVLQGLNSKDSKIRIRTMIVVRERFEAEDSPISYSWSLNERSVLDVEEIRAIEASFLTDVGKTLCNISKGTFSFTTFDERILAASTMDKLVTAVGSSQQETVLSFADMMLDLVRVETITDCLSEVDAKQAECKLASNCVDLFTSLVRSLGKHAVRFVPEVLASASGILEKVFSTECSSSNSELGLSISFCTMISVSEAAIKFITAVLDDCPSFLGTRTLQVLITLNLCSEADVLNDLLQLAMSKALPGTIAMALSKTTKDMSECDASCDGIARVMRALSCGLDRMHKSEISLHMDQFVQSIISCLEYGRDEPCATPRAGTDNRANAINPQGPAESLLIEYGGVDQSCNEALTSLIYKLPESKFKKLFNRFAQWCDGGSLSLEVQAACEALEEDVVPNVTRATPFYRLVQHLSEKLHSIMVPYVFEILEDVLSHVSRRKVGIRDVDLVEGEVESPNRKRKRSEMEKESQLILCSLLVGSHAQVIQCCLETVILLLKQNLGAELFTPTVAAKILDSLLAAFDNCDGESERVSQALCSLALRITASGKAAESREESREQLTSFARSLLLRTRETSGKTRAAALRVSCAVAQAVGDEYLVTLPESMPVLAEVIDDENSLVRKETKRYVRILEGLAGENIMDQLK